MIKVDQLYTVEDHDNGAKMEIVDQFGNDTGSFLIVVGVDSKKWRSLAAKILKVEKEPDKSGSPEATAKVLSETVLGWEGLESDGKPAEFSKKAILALLINAPYILAQITQFLLNRSNFTKG